MVTRRMVMLFPPGIQNCGNMCFASSIFQCLLNQKLFKELFNELSECHKNQCEKCTSATGSTEVCAIGALCKFAESYVYSSKKEILHSNDLQSSLPLIHPSIIPGEPFDAHEFLIKLLNYLLHMLPSRSRSMFERSITVSMSRELSCKACKNHKATTENEPCIELQARSEVESLRELFMNKFQEEDIPDGICFDCKNVGVTSTLTLTSLPPLLFIHLSKSKRIKIENTFLRVEAGAMYKLVGCIIYYPLSPTFGHYISYIWDHKQKEWFLTDDAKVSNVGYTEVLSQDPVLLLYAKCEGELCLSVKDRRLLNVIFIYSYVISLTWLLTEWDRVKDHRYLTVLFIYSFFIPVIWLLTALSPFQAIDILEVIKEMIKKVIKKVMDEMEEGVAMEVNDVIEEEDVEMEEVD